MKTESKKIINTVSHNDPTPSRVFDWNGAFGDVTDMISDIWGKPDTTTIVAPEPEKDNTLLYVGIGAVALMFILVVIVLLKK